MTSINDIDMGSGSTMNFYDPRQNERVSLIPKQLYPMHIKKVTTRLKSIILLM